MKQRAFLSSVHLTYHEYDLRWAFYGNGNRALVVVDNGVVALKASVNTGDILDDDEIAIKDWHENKGILDSLLAADVLNEVIRTIPIGHCEAVVCRIAK